MKGVVKEKVTDLTLPIIFESEPWNEVVHKLILSLVDSVVACRDPLHIISVYRTYSKEVLLLTFIVEDDDDDDDEDDDDDDELLPPNALVAEAPEEEDAG